MGCEAFWDVRRGFLMGVRKAAYVISKEMEITDAIKFVIWKSPGTTTLGILARLRSYGWTAKDEYLSGQKIGVLLRKMGENGSIRVERRKNSLRYWPTKVQEAPA